MALPRRRLADTASGIAIPLNGLLVYKRDRLRQAGVGQSFPSLAFFCALLPRSLAVRPVALSRKVLYALIVLAAISLGTEGSI